MYSEYKESIKELRECGYAVVVFTPDELKGSNHADIEDEMCEAGLHLIDLFHDPDFDNSYQSSYPYGRKLVNSMI